MGRIWVPRANWLLKKCSWPFDVLYVPRPGADLSGDTDLPGEPDGLGLRAIRLWGSAAKECLHGDKAVMGTRLAIAIAQTCQKMSFWASYISARKSVGRIWVPRANRLLKKCSWPFDVLYVPRPGADLSGDTDLPGEPDGLGLRAIRLWGSAAKECLHGDKAVMGTRLAITIAQLPGDVVLGLLYFSQEISGTHLGSSC